MNSIHLEAAKNLINKTSAIFWFRRDLRLNDNVGLYQALQHHEEVVPLFIFDTNILSKLDHKADRRVHFIHHSLQQLTQTLRELGSTLVVLHGAADEIFQVLTPGNVYTNNDYEPYARERDEKVRQILAQKNCPFHSFKDHVIFEKNDVLKNDGRPYTVFTPYSKRWKNSLDDCDLTRYDIRQLAPRLKKMDPLPLPPLTDIGFVTTDTVFPDGEIRTDIIGNYTRDRNYPALQAT